MHKTKILIVEDETIVALDIRNALLNMGHEVTQYVTNYTDALESVNKNTPDIIIMDIYLEGSKDGIEIAHDIQKQKNIPIVYLSAFSDDETINRAVQTNPIAYLTKPFDRMELKSTILLALHKMNQANQSILEHDCIPLGYNYYYDTKNENLYYSTLPIKLSVKERILLKTLIEAKGAIVSFKELEYQIWPDEPVSESTLRTLIYRIRTKLEYRLIETVPTFGCKLTPLY